MAKSDDILKKYGISQVTGSGGSPSSQKGSSQTKETGTSKADRILAQYGVTQVKKSNYASAQEWAEASNSLISEIQQHYGSWHEQDDEKYNGFQAKLYSHLSQGDVFRRQYEGDDEAANAIGSILSALNNANSFATQNRDYFSQWKTQQDYDDFLSYQKDYEEKRTFDLEAGQQEVADLERLLDEYKALSRTMIDDKMQARLDYIRNEYGEEKDIRNLISRKKQYLNQAQRIQNGVALSAVAENEDFRQESGYRSTIQEDKSRWEYGVGDTQYEWINNKNGFRSEWEQQNADINAKAGVHGPQESVYYQKGYDRMYAAEIAIYNYYYAKEGKEKAQEYLNSIQDSLNQRKAASMYAEMEGGTGMEMLFGIQAGLDQFKGGIQGAVRGALGDGAYVAPSATQYASGMVREDLADDGAKLPSWLGGASLGQAGYDLLTTTANMAPSVAIGMLNPTLGTAALGVSAGGSAYQEALNEGYTVEQARGYGILSGASEIVMEKLLGGISAYGGNAMGKFFARNMKNADTALKRIARVLGGMLSEFSEEYLQEVLTPVFRNLTLGTEEEVKLVSADALYSGFLGAITGGVMEAPSAIAGAGNAVAAKNATTEESPAVGDKMKATEVATGKEVLQVAQGENTESTVSKISGQNESSKVKVGVSKMETVQLTKDIESFARQFGTQAEAVRRNYLEGQQKHEAENLQEYQVGFQAAFAIGLEGGKEEALGNVPYLSQSQREIAYSLGRDAAAAQKAVAPKSKAFASGKLVSDGADAAAVHVAEIVSMDDTSMTFRLEDGRTVTDDDLNFDNGQQLLSAAWDLGMDVASVNTILQESAGSSASDAALAAGIQEAHHYGIHGYTMEQLAQHGSDASVLTIGQRKAAWEAGRKIYLQQSEAPAAVAKASKASGVWFDNGGGNVVAFDDYDVSGVSEAAVAGVKAAQVLQRLGIGRNFYFFESYENEAGDRVYTDENGVERNAPNGWYDPVDGSIHIDLNAGADGKGLTLYTLSHELTHFVEKQDKQGYRRLAEFLVANYAKGGNVDAMVAEKQAELSASRGSEVSYEEAYSEFIADSMEAMLSDGNVLEKLQELKKTDRNLFDKIKEFFDNLAKKIRAIYKDLKPDSAEGQAVLEMKDQIEQIQQLFAEALVQASENYQAAAEVGLEIDDETESVSPAVMHSERTWRESDYVKERNKAAEEIHKAIGVSVKKAKQYIDSVNSIAKMIAEDRTRLDYFSSPNRSSFIGNVEYGGSFDFSTLCKKRRLLTGTFTAIQKALPNTALTANEILDIRNRMKEAGLEVSCGLCYVEGSRANMGQFAKEFLRLYKQYYPDAWQPNMADVNTPDGIEWVRINHPECYEQYEYFWNHYGTLKAGDKNLFASQQKPKLYQLHTEYKGEILQKFKGDDNVEEKNLNGGIRLQSFSDFEIVHLIDTMQIIMDMSRVGLAGQAYTKVPDFAWALGDTGLKINLSLIAKGVDAEGNLIFDDIEGMPIAEAMKLRDRYSANVGTILVAFNDAQLMAAMKDSRVDFIIPFHRSQWKKSQYEAMGLPAKTKDYTFMQNEMFIKPQYHEYRGRMVKDKATNYMPNEYWDFSKSGKENAVAYLEMCARNNKRPKFYKLLQNNGDGSYSLKADGSTDGYWKLLIDFKMYDNDGNGSPQTAVRPEFNMEESARMMREYKGGHSSFPVAQGIVDSFVSEYKESHGERMYSERKPASKKITMSMTDSERSDILKDKVITAEVYEGQADQTIAAEKENLKSHKENLVKTALAKIGDEFGVFTDYSIADVDVDIRFSRSNLKESISKKIDPITIAKLLPTLKTAVEKAVGIECHANRYFYDNDTVMFENLLGGYVDGEKFIPIRFGLKHSVTGKATLYLIVDQEGINVKKIKAEVTKTTGAQNVHSKVSRSAYDVSIASVIPFVNGKDLLRYLPDDMLNTQQKSTKYEAMAETVVYTNDKNDRKFASFIKSGNLLAAKSMVAAAARANGYSLKAYHQTGATFTEFSTANPVAGKNDSETPNGIFFKTNDHDIGLNGGIQMEVFLNVQNMLHFKNREEANAWYCDHIPGYRKLQDQLHAEIKPINDEIESMQDEFWAEETSEERYEELSAIEDQLIAQMGAIEDDYRGRLRSLLDEYFLSGNSGYDGIELDYDGRRWVNGKREDVHTYIAFSPEQAKSADVITYDNEGNIVPISQRFDPRKKDIRYQTRATGTSNRALLAGAFEDLVRSPAEMEFLQKYQENIGLLNEQEAKLQEIRTEIRDLTFGKGTKDPKRLAQLQEEAGKTANRIHIYDKKLLQLETAKPLRDVLDREREKVRKATRQKGREALENYREKRKESAAKKDARRKIRKTVFELDKILNRGDKKKHVKDGMNAMVSSSLKLADALFMDEYTNRDMLRNGVGVELTEGEEKLFQEARQLMEAIESGAAMEGMEFASEIDAMDQLKKLDQKLSSKMAGLKDVFARERKRLYGTTVSDLLGKLADEYSKLREAEDGAVRGAMDENVYAHLLQLQKDVSGTTVRDMTLGQLEAVADAYTMVLTTVRNANKMFAKNLKFKRDTLVGMVIGEIGSAAKKLSKLIRPGKNAIDSFSWNNLKPVYAFERLGSGTLKTLYQNIRDGQDIWSVDMQEADTFRREQYKKHSRKDWDLEKQHSFEFESGKVDLSLEQIMSLYAYSRREQALEHLLKGGFVFSGSTEVMVKEHGIQQRYLKKDATAYNLSADELAQVIGTLTKDQKAFVEEMQTYLSEVMGGKGNEVSLQMYGIKSFGEKNYFPIRSAGQYMEKAKEDSFRKEQGQISIVNSGFTKSTAPKANNPITLDGFMNVWSEHVNEMSMYHGFALPMEDFRRVYNYSSPNMEVGNSQSVNAAIENAFGKAATGYIDQLYQDVNGGAVGDNRENLSKKLVSLHKKAAVFASASVVIQQPSAIVRAFALIDPRHFVGPKVDRKRHKALWEEVKKYAPVAFVKEMGYFDTGMGRSARDFLQAEEYSGIGEKMAALFKDADYRDEILSKAPALADELTWCSIWEAVKRETKARNPDMDGKSDAFLKIAGARFSEVIDKTQVYDSVLSRSANMRSRSGLMNMATSFLSEPTTSINMLEDALRKGDGKQLARTVGAVYGSMLLNSLLVSLVYAARDDDEDETWWEKYLSSVAVEILDGINPITYYPFLRDIWSIGQGFDVERADMVLITDFANAAQQVTKAIRKVQQADADAQQEVLGDLKDSLWGMADSVASLTGLPLKNFRRDVEGILNLYRTIRTDLSGRKTTALSLQDAVLADVMASIPAGDLLYSKDKRDKLYDAVMAGDTAYQDRLKSGYKDQSAVNSAIRKALRENDPRIRQAAQAKFSGNLSEYTRLAKQIIAEKHFSQNDVVAAINAEINLLDNDEASGSGTKASGLYKAEDFAAAISSGNSVMANAVRTDIIKTAQKNGKSEADAEKSFNSSAKSALKELFLEGKLSEQKAIHALTGYCGADEVSAMADVQYWAFKQDYPNVYADDSWFDAYYEDVADSGMDIGLYMEYRNRVKSIDGDGKKERRMAVIDSLPITVAQKDALYFAEGWAESKLWQAPWH